MNRRKVLALAAALPLTSLATRSSAQTGSAKILAGFAPGSGVVDVLARTLAEKIKGDYSPTVIVDNRPGVGGQLAVVALKSAPADGSVMLVAPMSNMSVHPHIYLKLGYDPVKDLAPVGNCVTSDLILAVGPSVPSEVTDVPSLMQWFRSNPSSASFATGATGSKLHFAGMKLGLHEKVALTHVGYTNGGTALTDLAGGSVPAYVGTVASVLPFTNRVRVLATMGNSRSRFLPSVPTLLEGGYRSMVVTETVALYVPAGVPPRQIATLHASMAKALSTPEAEKVLATAGVEVSLSDGAAVTAQMKREHEEWGALIKEIGFRAQS